MLKPIIKFFKRIKNFLRGSTTIWVITCTEFGETCNSHSKVVKVFNTKNEAEEWVKEDMKDVIDYGGIEDSAIIDWVRQEVWSNSEKTEGCIWDIHTINLN